MLAQALGRRSRDSRADRGGALAFEGATSTGELVQHDSEGPDVGAGVDVLGVVKLLG